ncbi:MAG: PPC domain-containing protein [Methanobacteriota archaeon]
MRPMLVGRRSILLVSAVAFGMLAVPPMAAAPQSDAGVPGDAGNTFATGRTIAPSGPYWGTLDGFPSDADDYYRFFVPAGDSVNIEIRAGLVTGTPFPGDDHKRLSFQLVGPDGVPLDTPNTINSDSRVTLVSAPVSGTYGFHVTDNLGIGHRGAYGFCFVRFAVPCPEFGTRPIRLIGALQHPMAEILLEVPPHGDLGNAAGPTRDDYLAAAVRGIHRWEAAIDAFVADHPDFSYLSALKMHVAVFDGPVPERVGVDMTILWIPASGSQFRGVASPGTDYLWEGVCWEPFSCGVYYGSVEPHAHLSDGLVVLSLLANAPRAGQLVQDYPEVNDIENVVMHEVAHAWGLGHTQTWHADTGPDAMNSPYGQVFGDGDPLGFGPERTAVSCISSVDLYGLAYIFRWLPSGVFARPDVPEVTAPFAYELYC